MIQEFTLPELAAAYRHSIKRGPFGGALKKEIFVCEGFVVYEQQHAIYKRFNDARYYIDQNKYEELEAFKVEEGDLIISCSGTIGKIAEVPKGFKPGIINQALLKVTLDQSKVLNKYFIHLFEGEKIQNQLFSMSHGTGLKNFPPMAVVKSIKVPLPPLEEQKKIAAILDAADEYRQKTKALIDKYDQLTQSLFLDMFGDPVTNPKGWQRFQLKEFGKIITGNTPSKKHPEYYDQSFIEWIKTDNIVDGVKCITPSKSYLSQNGLKHGRSVKAGSVLIACIAGSLKSIGKAALTDRTVAFNQQINAVEPNNTVDSNFLYYLIRVNKVYIQSFASSSMKKMISKGVLKEIVFYLPPIEIQNQFTEKVEQIEKQKQQAEASLVKAEELFNSLLQTAFKGELTC